MFDTSEPLFFPGLVAPCTKCGHHDDNHVRLEMLNEVVKEIAAIPSILTTELLLDFPKALAACQCAITLRERVAAYFADAERGHQHFLDRLRTWFNILIGVNVGPEEEKKTTAEAENKKFANYYEVLEVDEDYFPDEGTFVAEPTAAKIFKVDRQKLLDEAFAEDMRLEVAYFFVELEELVETVFTIYEQVKIQEHTMMEATVVTKLALDTVNGLTATLQLRYPSLRTAKDFYNIVAKNDPENFASRISEAYVIAKDSLKGEGVFKFVPGMFLLYFLSTKTTLHAFTGIIPPNLRYGIALPQGFYGASYDEEQTPHYVFPNPRYIAVFLLQQLPELFNTLTYMKVASSKTYETIEAPDWGLAGSFMTVMDTYFTSREVAVSTVFACICWLVAVAALQGDGGLSRNTKSTLTHSSDLKAEIGASVANGAIQAADIGLHRFLQCFTKEIECAAGYDHLAHRNPLISGLIMAGHHLKYLDLASETVATRTLGTFGHLYNALVNEGYCRRVPFFEEVLSTYEQMIFTPSRAAAVRGSYYRSLLLSSSMKATVVDAATRGKGVVTGAGNTKQRPVLFLKDVSKIFRLMTRGDRSFLRGISSKALLDKAADICSQELFETRVLSRDMLKLHDDLTDAFSKIRNALSEQKLCYSKNDHEATGRVLYLLDALQPNGEIDMNLLPGNSCARAGSLNGEPAIIVCKKVAEVIESMFPASLDFYEERYFLFPSTSSEKKPAASTPSCEGSQVTSEIAAGEITKAGRKKMKSKKKKKKNKHKKSDKSETNEKAATTTGDGDLEEVSSMLKELLGLAGVNVHVNQDQPSSTFLEHALRQSTATAFARLRDPSIPPFRKANDVGHVCDVVKKLQRQAKEFAENSRLNGTSQSLLNSFFSEASRIIHMMQKFHRDDHYALTVPALITLRELCDTGPAFTQFLVSTARIGTCVDKMLQVRELLDLLEKRLLKMRIGKSKHPCYRQLVLTYSIARNEMGLGRTSSPDTFHSLEWYLTNTMGNDALRLDAMYGRPFYLDLVIRDCQNTRYVEEMIALLPGMICIGDRVKRIVYGGPNRDVVEMARDAAVKIVKLLGGHVSESCYRYCTTSIYIGGFKFSSAGIFRDSKAE